MSDLADVSTLEIVVELCARLAVAKTREEQEEVRDALPGLGKAVTIAEGYQGIHPGRLPLQHVPPHILVSALNTWLAAREDRVLSKTLWAELFCSGSNVVRLVEVMAARRWFESAESLGGLIGRPPYRTNGLFNCRGATKGRLLAIAVERLKALAQDLAGTPTADQYVMVYELLWWYMIGRGLIGTVSYESDLVEAGGDIGDIEQAFVAAQTAIQSWDYRRDIVAWGSVDPDAPPLNWLFEDLRLRIEEQQNISPFPLR